MLAAGSCGLACSTDTTGLARRAPEAEAPGAGGNDAGSSGSGGAAGSGAAGATPAPEDPSGGGVEVVHGLVDGGSLFVCLREAVSGAPLATDTPQPSQGVPYGRAWGLPISWDVASDDVEMELFVGVPSTLAGQSCSDLRAQAGPAEPLPPSTSDAAVPDAGLLGAAPFPLEPEVPRRGGAVRLAPGVVRAGGHYVLVAAGCTHPDGSSGDDVCGPADALFGARQTVVLAEIASELPARDEAFGLQFLNASRAVPRADLVLQWESQRQSLRVASDVGFSAVRPRDAAAVDDEPVGLELHVRGERLSSFTQAWDDTVATSSAGEFASGGNYLAAYVGPLPGAAITGVATPRFVLIRGRAAAAGSALAQ